MSKKIAAPKGTHDWLPPITSARRVVLDRAKKAFDAYRFQEIETPIFEQTDIFARGVGATSDIVSKEMFSFVDQGARPLTLRPEGTAAVCRAYVEHGMHKWTDQPVKLWYSGPFFRQEAPQKGRYRQFTQIGAETLGDESAWSDAESIAMAARIVWDCEVGDCEIRISTLGSIRERLKYREVLAEFLRARETELATDIRDRINSNPLRAFDSKDERTIEVMKEAPKLLDYVSKEDLERFDSVRFLLAGFLGTLDVSYRVVVDPTLVRGLDYYNQTVFEIVSQSSELGAQSTLGGGGRYDGLVAEMGGPETACFGWAIGVERILIANENALDIEGAPIYVAVDEGFNEQRLWTLLAVLRLHGQPTAFGGENRSIRSQFKQAHRIGASKLVLLGGAKPAGAPRNEYEFYWKNFETGESGEFDSSEGNFTKDVCSALDITV